mgnify:CR=1 FL=1
MNIWLDDIRLPPGSDWIWVKSVNQAKQIIREFETMGFTHNIKLSLDHDLGDFFCDGGDGISLMDWLVTRNTLYPVTFHTQNPVGRANMERMYRRYWLKESL